MLSLGEQQRISFARALFHQPLLCVMDEATSALDAASQEQRMQLAQTRLRAIIHVAHRRELIVYHDYVLELHSGGWRLRSA